jgi:hypothetical protein
MSDFDSSSSIELDDLLRSVDSLVAQLDRTGAEIADRFQSRLDDETLSSVAPPSEEPAQLGEQVDELISDAIDAVESLDEEIEESPDVTDQDEQAVDELAAQVDELIADAEEVAGVEDEASADAIDSAVPEVEVEVEVEIEIEVEDVVEQGADEVVIQTDEAPVIADDASIDESPVEEAAVEDDIMKATFDAATDVIDEQVVVDDSPTEETAVDEAGADDSATDDDTVDATFDTASDVIEEEAPEPASAATPLPLPNETIESLDSAIASEADSVEDELDELAGDFSSIDDIAESEPAPAPAPVEHASKTPVAAKSAASKAVENDGEDDTKSTGSTSPLKQLIARVRSLAPKMKGKDENPLAQSLLHVLTPMARPLMKLDPKMRDTVGWVALNTLFIAICLWLFLILR